MYITATVDRTVATQSNDSRRTHFFFPSKTNCGKFEVAVCLQLKRFELFAFGDSEAVHRLEMTNDEGNDYMAFDCF